MRERRVGALVGRDWSEKGLADAKGYVRRILAPEPRCRENRPKREKGSSETECMYMGIRPDAGPIQPYVANDGDGIPVGPLEREDAPPLLSRAFWSGPLVNVMG
jgi:hypothetical protein